VALFSLAAAVLGGALFPIQVLPSWIRWMSYLVPHSYVISAERQLLMQNPPPGGLPLYASIGILVAFCAVTFVAGLFVFDRALRLARRLGILSIGASDRAGGKPGRCCARTARVGWPSGRPGSRTGASVRPNWTVTWISTTSRTRGG
jgi:hypothetical protein